MLQILQICRKNAGVEQKQVAVAAQPAAGRLGKNNKSLPPHSCIVGRDFKKGRGML